MGWGDALKGGEGDTHSCCGVALLTGRSMSAWTRNLSPNVPGSRLTREKEENLFES